MRVLKVLCNLLVLVLIGLESWQYVKLRYSYIHCQTTFDCQSCWSQFCKHLKAALLESQSKKWSLLQCPYPLCIELLFGCTLMTMHNLREKNQLTGTLAIVRQWKLQEIWISATVSQCGQPPSTVSRTCKSIPVCLLKRVQGKMRALYSHSWPILFFHTKDQS